MKQKLTEIKGEIDIFTLRVRDFSTFSRKLVGKECCKLVREEDLNTTINQFNLT